MSWVQRQRETVWISKAQRGDLSSLERLLSAHEAALFRWILGQVGDVSDAEDLVQEVFVAAWQRIEGFRGESSFKTWLFRIAWRKVVDGRRLKNRRPQIEWTEPDVMETHADPGSKDPLIQLEREERRRAVHRALEWLPEEQKEVVALYYFGDMTLAEVASVTGQNLNTVKYRFYQAHRVLERRLTEEELSTDQSAPARANGKGSRNAL